jgi:glycosyltransferase involved in cell wall biosynthesis
MRPLVSFCLIGYNQEAFIREAVAGALAQTYSPLQIILSDDASSDRTFEIMKEMVEKAKSPHEIILRRESKNVGLIAHVNGAISAAQGELIVIAAGDDISDPERSEICFQAWEASGRKSRSIWSDYTVIDEKGDEILGKGLENDGLDGIFEHVSAVPEDIARWKGPVVLGCSHAFSREVFDKFGQFRVRADFTNEDIPIYFRSALLGGQATRIHKPLVRYRRHSANLSTGLVLQGAITSVGQPNDLRKSARSLKRMMEVCGSFWRDSRAMLRYGTPTSRIRPLCRVIAASRRAFQLEKKGLTAAGWIKLEVLWKLFLLGRGRKRVLVEIVRFLNPFQSK